jgi:hypothetical protein
MALLTNTSRKDRNRILLQLDWVTLEETGGRGQRRIATIGVTLDHANCVPRATPSVPLYASNQHRHFSRSMIKRDEYDDEGR